MPGKMKCAVIVEPKKIALEDRDIPTPGPDEVLIKVKASGFCGTDVHMYMGEFVDVVYPLVPGHEFSGDVVEVGANCNRIKKGMRVCVEPNVPCNNCQFCLGGQHHYCSNMYIPGRNRPGGMAEYSVCLERGVFDIGDVDYRVGSFVEPLSCVLHGVQRLNPGLGEKILIMGAGPIGMLLGRSINLRGAHQIDFLEIQPVRLEAAKKEKLGNVYSDPKELKCVYNSIIDATGVCKLVESAIDWLLPQGKLLIFGVPPLEGKLNLSSFKIFKQELQLLGSQTSIKDTIKAVDLLANKKIDVLDMISHVYKVEEFEKGLLALQSRSEEIRKAIITFD